MATYLIQAGDNLTKIAKAHGTTVQELVRLNNISDPNKIVAGTTIELCEEKQQPEVKAEVTQEQLNQQLKSMEQQLTDMQEQMNNTIQEETLNAWEIFGLGVGAYATGKAAEKAAPYVANGAKVAGKAVANGAKATRSAAVNGTKAAGKAVANGAKAAGRAATKGAGKALSAASKGVKALGTASKAMGPMMLPLTVAGIAVDAYDAYKEGGTEAALKSAGKDVACIAAGAAIGSIIPGVGTAIGAGIGAIVSIFV